MDRMTLDFASRCWSWILSFAFSLRYVGERVEEGQPLITIYAENKRKMEDARVLAGKLQPVQVEGMILGEVVE
jgi:thymidine phosphorylase